MEVDWVGNRGRGKGRGRKGGKGFGKPAAPPSKSKGGMQYAPADKGKGAGQFGKPQQSNMVSRNLMGIRFRDCRKRQQAGEGAVQIAPRWDRDT